MPHAEEVRAAAIYARISHDDSGQALGVERQEYLGRDLAERKGWPVAETYVDNDISASSYSKRERRAYRRMLADIEAGTIDAVVVLDQDRLVRRPEELEAFIDLANAHGVALANVSGDTDLSTSDGRLTARIRGSVAAHESEQKSERIRREREQRARRGVPHPGRRAYGYEQDGVTVRPDEAAIVREAAGRVLAGESVRSIARDLNARGVRPVKARQWHITSLRQVLANPRYAGLRVHKGEIVGEAVWRPILPREEHEELVAILGDPRRHTSRRGPDHLLTSLLRCGRCRATLYHSHRQTGDPRYVCHAAPGREGCGRLAIAGAPLEELVVEDVLELLTSSPVVGRAIEARRAGQVTETVEQLRADEALLEELARDLGEGRISRREWLAVRDPVEQRIREARATLARDASTRVLADLPPGDELRTAWPDLGLDRQRAMIAAVVEEIVVHPGRPGRRALDPARVEYRWRA